jgi:hypothetical protein
MNNYSLKLGKADQQLEVSGDKKFVLEMVKRFWSDASDDPIPSRVVPEKDKKDKNILSASGKSLAVGEFIRQMGIKKHTDFVLVFGYYLEKYVGMKEFAPADINKCYYDAKMESSNTSQMLIQNIKSGRIMLTKSAKKKGSKLYTLTQTGIDYIEKKLAKKPA